MDTVYDGEKQSAYIQYLYIYLFMNAHTIVYFTKQQFYLTFNFFISLTTYK